MMSVNDTFILQSLIYKLLERVISSVSLFYSVQKVFEDIKFVTELGQMLDLNTINHKTHSINYQFVFPCISYLPRYFTKDYYEQIITNKTAYYTIFLPVYLGLVLTESPKETMNSPQLRELCILLGRYFQIRDDFLDAFADPSVLGKEGTDIQEGKCSWVILTVFSLCSEEDKEALKELYGKSDPRPVKAIYAKYDVESEFRRFEDEALEKTREILASESFPDDRLKPLFNALIEKLFGNKAKN